MIAAITNALKGGEEVRLVGFGTFSVKARAAGKGRNPATGNEIDIPASKSVRFKPGAQLKTTSTNKLQRTSCVGGPTGRLVAFAVATGRTISPAGEAPLRTFLVCEAFMVCEAVRRRPRDFRLASPRRAL